MPSSMEFSPFWVSRDWDLNLRIWNIPGKRRNGHSPHLSCNTSADWSPKWATIFLLLVMGCSSEHGEVSAKNLVCGSARICSSLGVSGPTQWIVVTYWTNITGCSFVNHYNRGSIDMITVCSVRRKILGERAFVLSFGSMPVRITKKQAVCYDLAFEIRAKLSKTQPVDDKQLK